MDSEPLQQIDVSPLVELVTIACNGDLPGCPDRQGNLLDEPGQGATNDLWTLVTGKYVLGMGST